MKPTARRGPEDHRATRAVRMPGRAHRGIAATLHLTASEDGEHEFSLLFDTRGDLGERMRREQFED